MAEIIYNGVQLSYIATQGVSFDPVYDSLAGVDYMYTRATITLTAVISKTVAMGTGSYAVPPGIGSEDPAETVARLDHLLNTPRRGLLFQVNGKTIVRVSPSAADGVTAGSGGEVIGSGVYGTDPLLWSTGTVIRDEENGPMPRARVSQILGSGSIVIEFSVSACILTCPGNSGGLPEYLSHRWTEVSEIDESGMTKRTRSGKLVVRSSLLVNADQLRHIVMPNLEPDFLRTSSRYTLSADGRELAFEFVDIEQYIMPPVGASKAQGRYTLTTENGMVWFGECQLTLFGGKTVDKSALFAKASALCLAKLELSGIARIEKGTQKGAYILAATYSEDLMANAVTVRMRTRVRPTKQTANRNASVSIKQTIIADPKSVLSTVNTLLGSGNLNPGAIQNLANAGPAETYKTIDRARKPASTMVPGDNYSWLKVPAEWNASIVPSPGHEINTRFLVGSRGSANLLLVAAYMQDPCLRMAVLRSGPYGDAAFQSTLSTQPGVQPQLTGNHLPGGGFNPLPRVITAADGSANPSNPTVAESPSYRSNAGNAEVTISGLTNLPSFDPTSLIKDVSAGEADGVYETYIVNYRWVTDFNTFSLPVARPGAPAAVLTTAAPYSRKRAEWTAIKVGAPPTVPTWLLQDTNWTVTKTQVDPGAVEPTTGSNDLRYTVAGLYEWVATKAVDSLAGFSALPPWADMLLWQNTNPTVASALAPAVTSPYILEPPYVQRSFTTGSPPVLQVIPTITVPPPILSSLPPAQPSTGGVGGVPGLSGVSMQNGSL